jgi:hypothetical protein
VNGPGAPVVSSGIEWVRQDGLSTHSVLTWYSHDALTVYAEFPGDENGPVEWVIARSLFFDAIATGESGIGDVQMIATLEEDVFIMFLKSPHGEAAIKTSLAPIVRFLEETNKVVADGAENIAADIDSAIELILEGT